MEQLVASVDASGALAWAAAVGENCSYWGCRTGCDDDGGRLFGRRNSIDAEAVTVYWIANGGSDAFTGL